MLRKVIFNLIKENHGLHEDDVIAEHMVPTKFNEETEFLSDSNTNSLKRHYILAEIILIYIRLQSLNVLLLKGLVNTSLIFSSFLMYENFVILAAIPSLPQ
jgi:hypothetical protein